MSGGVAYIRKTEENLQNISMKLLSLYELDDSDFTHVKRLIKDFNRYTSSNYGKKIINEIEANDFVKVIPNDYYKIITLLDKYKDNKDPEMEAFKEAIAD